MTDDRASDGARRLPGGGYFRDRGEGMVTLYSRDGEWLYTAPEHAWRNAFAPQLQGDREGLVRQLSEHAAFHRREAKKYPSTRSDDVFARIDHEVVAGLMEDAARALSAPAEATERPVQGEALNELIQLREDVRQWDFGATTRAEAAVSVLDTLERRLRLAAAPPQESAPKGQRPLPDRPLMRERPAQGEAWSIVEGVRCVECPDCLFTFDARHEDAGGGYTCPLCESPAPPAAARVAEATEARKKAVNEIIASTIEACARAEGFDSFRDSDWSVPGEQLVTDALETLRRHGL